MTDKEIDILKKRSEAYSEIIRDLCKENSLIVKQTISAYMATGLITQSDVEDLLDCKNKNPHLGVTPRYVWDRSRMRKLGEAIAQYCTSDKSVPAEWIDEYNELNERLFHK